MPVEQFAPPTIDEIRRDLAAYEQRYNMSTSEFLKRDGCVVGIDEDDAVEWLYRAEQIRFLQEQAVVSPYAHLEHAVPLKTCTDTMDRLAA
jgi:hypothetical protein